jgi:hypothetical protein
VFSFLWSFCLFVSRFSVSMCQCLCIGSQNGVDLVLGLLHGGGYFLVSWLRCCCFAGGVSLTPAMALVVKGGFEMGWW